MLGRILTHVRQHPPILISALALVISLSTAFIAYLSFERSSENIGLVAQNSHAQVLHRGGCCIEFGGYHIVLPIQIVNASNSDTSIVGCEVKSEYKNTFASWYEICFPFDLEKEVGERLGRFPIYVKAGQSIEAHVSIAFYKTEKILEKGYEEVRETCRARQFGDAIKCTYNEWKLRGVILPIAEEWTPFRIRPDTLDSTMIKWALDRLSPTSSAEFAFVTARGGRFNFDVDFFTWKEPGESTASNGIPGT